MGNTIAKSGVFTGVGIHSGRPVTLEVFPAEAGKGIVFIHKQFPDSIIEVKPENVQAVDLGTNLVADGFIVRTIEHLMAVLNVLNISDLIFVVDSDEIPVLDGSSKDYYNQIMEIGLKDNGPSRTILLKQNVNVEMGDSYLIALPYAGFKITYTVDYRPSILGVQTFIFEEGKTDFLKEIAPARTFGHIKDLDYMHSKGLALGASLDNALGIGETQYLNEPRFVDEAVRHKTLDLIGDIYNLGQKLNAHIVAYKSSHKLNAMLVKAVSGILI